MQCYKQINMHRPMCVYNTYTVGVIESVTDLFLFLKKKK